MDMKLGFYTLTTRNRTPDRRMAVHYTTANSSSIVDDDGYMRRMGQGAGNVNVTAHLL